jgi:hypothetical protein
VALEDRVELVATVQETYALMGHALQVDVPGLWLKGLSDPRCFSNFRRWQATHT